MIENKYEKAFADAGYEVSKSIFVATRQYIIPLISSNMNTFNQKQQAIVETFLRCQDYMGSIIEMKGYSNYQSLAAAARSTMELLFDMLMLRADTTGVLVKNRNAFFCISEFADAENFIKFYDEHKISHDNNYSLNKLLLKKMSVDRKQFENNLVCKGNAFLFKGNDKYKHHWSGMTMFKRAEILDEEDGGVKYRLMYKKYSASLNSYVHSGCVGSVESRPARFLTTYGFTHNLAQDIFKESSIICAQCLRPNINNTEITEAISAINEAYENGIDKLDAMKRSLFNSQNNLDT